MIALLDADTITYRIAPLNEENSLEDAITHAELYLEEIITKSGAEEFQLFLSGTNNFRKTIWPLYKANRPHQRPKHYQGLRDWMVTKYGAVLSNLCEADDELGVRQTEDTVICSIDKDLLQIPGKHFNFVTNVHQEIDEYNGQRRFWKQMIMGDRTDNIVGIVGLGDKKSENILRQLHSDEWEDYVKDLYDDPLRFDLNFNLLTIWQKPYQYREDGVNYLAKSPEEYVKKLEQLRDKFAKLLEGIGEPDCENEVNTEHQEKEASLKIDSQQS